MRVFTHKPNLRSKETNKWIHKYKFINEKINKNLSQVNIYRAEIIMTLWISHVQIHSGTSNRVGKENR